MSKAARSAGYSLCNLNCHGCTIGCATPGDRHERMRLAIRSGKKAEALPAIERCTDVGFLRDAELAVLRGDWRRAAVATRIGQLEYEQNEAAAEAGEKTEDEF